MQLHIRTRPGLGLDITNEARDIPDVDNLKIWHEFRVHRPPKMKLDTDGSIIFADKYDLSFGFSTSRLVFTNVMTRAWNVYHDHTDFTGHIVIFQMRHPERRIFVPKDILYDVRARGLRAYRRYDKRAATQLANWQKAS